MLTTRRARSGRSAGPARRRRRPDGDAGASLVELSVAMAVTAAVLAAVTAGLVLLVGAYTRVQDHSLAVDRGRVLLDRLDGELRWASSVNHPVRQGQRYFLEYQSEPVSAGATATCSQWRFDAQRDTLSTRSWPVGATAEPDWAVVASGVTNDPQQRPPFVLTPAGGGLTHQQVALRLELTLPRGTGISTALLTARNSSAASPSNADTNGNGRSDTEICTTFGRS